MRLVTVLAALMALAAAPIAGAQNLTLQAPDWATRLVAADLLPTTGGRAALSAPGLDFAVRVTIAPNAGGVARVIRYEARGEQTQIFLRRFTGHPTAGWWLWGPDAPQIATPQPGLRREIERLARSAVALGGTNVAPEETNCPLGERGFVEIFAQGRSTSATRACIGAVDPVGALMRRLSDIAGSRDEDELYAAGERELLEADRAFASGEMRVVAPDLRSLRAEQAPQATGRTPEGARVSSRGDMGWTWGQIAGAPYITVWTRTDEGAWRISADAR